MDDMNYLTGVDHATYLVLAFFFLFQIKHLVVDFFIQNRFPYMWMNKHDPRHPGGWYHAGGHGVASFLILMMGSLTAGTELVVITGVLCVAEILVHFGIDCAKMNFSKAKGWKCNTHAEFWDLLGVDQFLHQLTYLIMILVWMRSLAS